MKKAFTLAEVLITLGIIGIVAAMTLPVLVDKYQKIITVNRLKKAYTLLSQVTTAVNYEMGGFENYGNASAPWTNTFFETYLKKHLQIIKDCKSDIYCWNSQGGWLNPDGSGPVRFSDYGDEKETRIVFLRDGSSLYISRYGYMSLEIYSGYNILVDINGRNKPNTLGKDIFNFQLGFNLEEQHGCPTMPGLRLLGSGCNKEYINSMCNKYYGTQCGAKIEADGWQIKDDYPW